MSIDKDTVRYIGELARINLREEELDKLLPQLFKILSYVEKINELDLENIEPLFNIVEENNVVREDKPVKFNNIQGIIKLFPDRQENFTKVPKVIE